MSASRAPHLSQLVHAATPDPVEVEKADLRQQIAAASAILVAEARCFPKDHEGMQEEKTMWLRRWEEKMAMLMPLVERGKELGVMVRVDAAEAPILAKVDNVYEWWTAEEAKVRARTKQDVLMGDENAQETGGPGASVAVPVVTEKMLHVEVVSRPVRKTVAESEDEDEPEIVIPPSSILHKVLCTWCMGCKKSTKAAGKKAQAGASVARASKTAKASSSKRVVDDDDDDDKVEVVESHTCAKGKAAVRSQLNAKVRIDQLAEALEKIGVE
ncbi:hypothetical protein M404DRAFT_19837 [Pisolithus tinctorius Marx 270]|uniref:Uncharacterized protein n=1 Tax=Pisolithus tinctorius Marx 270 TaxID=870435 RepID=A0A0C3PSB8_PISTI|nr:hypothetical protein M404DRAFT_19837 [Pisolithus tinctorius Marx 270]